MDKNFKDFDFNIIRWFDFQGPVSVVEGIIRYVCGWAGIFAFAKLTEKFIKNIISSLCATQYRVGSYPYRYLFESYEIWYLTIIAILLLTLMYSTAAKRVNAVGYDSEKLKYVWCVLSGTMALHALAFMHADKGFSILSDIFFITDGIGGLGFITSIPATFFIIVAPEKLGLAKAKEDSKKR